MVWFDFRKFQVINLAICNYLDQMSAGDNAAQGGPRLLEQIDVLNVSIKLLELLLSKLHMKLYLLHNIYKM